MELMITENYCDMILDFLDGGRWIFADDFWNLQMTWILYKLDKVVKKVTLGDLKYGLSAKKRLVSLETLSNL